MQQVVPEDLMKFGIIPEFIGRIPIIASLEKLTEDDLVRILTEPKNALVKQYQKLLSLDNTELEFTSGALHAIAHKAIERDTGARGLRSIIEAVMQDMMFTLPSEPDVTKAVVTKAAVEGTGKPELIKEKDQKAS